MNYKKTFLLISLIFTTPLWSAEKIDFRCNASECVIPYNSEGIKDGIETCYDSKEKKIKMKEISWKKGIRQGSAKCFKNNEVSVEANYENDELNGLFIEYKYDSVGERVQVLRNGIAQGYAFKATGGEVKDINWCFQDGVIQAEGLKNCPEQNYGRYAGAIKTFLQAKEKERALSEEERKLYMNGPQIKKFSNGKTRTIYTNVNGRISGNYKAYQEDGKLLEDCEYKEGKKNGLCQEFDKLGFLNSKSTFDNDRLTYKESFYNNGKISEKFEQPIKNQKICTTEYFDNGNKSSYNCYLEGRNYWVKKYLGTYDSWYLNGKLLEHGEYVEGNRIGEWITYGDDGKVVRRSTYEKGVLAKTIEYLLYKEKNNTLVPYTYRIIREYFPDGSTKKEEELPGHE